MGNGDLPVNSFSRLWKFFTSIKLAVGVLLSLAATSVIGTIVPQNESLSAYLHQYGEVLYRIFYVLNIFDMYHSLWFQFLLLLLTVNIIVCSIARLSATWKIIFPGKTTPTSSKFGKFSEKTEFTVDKKPEDLKDTYYSFISRRFGNSRVEDTEGPAEKGFCIFAEKGRWTRIGVYIVHISVVLLLLGGLIGSIFGFEGFANIPEGEAVSQFHLKKNNEIKQLGFEIRCDDFDVSFYDSGAPKEYRSALTVLENGKAVKQKNIIVNDPLRYKGISIFQASYGMIPPKHLTLNITSNETGMVYTQKAAAEKPFDLPEGMGQFVIRDFDTSYLFMGRDIGETFLGTLTPTGEEPAEVIIPLKFPNFDKMRKGRCLISVADYEARYFTGLQITRDPGVAVVYTGFVFIIIGFVITFFLSHQRIYIQVSENGEKSIVSVTGSANKNKIGMENRIKSISRKLEESPD